MGWLTDKVYGAGKFLFDNGVYNTEKSLFSVENGLNVAFIGASVVAGVFTGGLGTAAMFTARAGVMGGAKVLGRKVIVEAAEVAAKREAAKEAGIHLGKDALAHLSARETMWLLEKSLKNIKGWRKADFNQLSGAAQRRLGELNHNLPNGEAVEKLLFSATSNIVEGTLVAQHRKKLLMGAIGTGVGTKVLTGAYAQAANTTPDVVAPTLRRNAQPMTQPNTEDGGISGTFNALLGGGFDSAVDLVDDYIPHDYAKLLVGSVLAVGSMLAGSQVGGFKGLAIMSTLLYGTYQAANSSATDVDFERNSLIGPYAQFVNKYL